MDILYSSHGRVDLREREIPTPQLRYLALLRVRPGYEYMIPFSQRVEQRVQLVIFCLPPFKRLFIMFRAFIAQSVASIRRPPNQRDN